MARPWRVDLNLVHRNVAYPRRRVFASSNPLSCETGSCSCVGVLGAALGGGIGPYQGVHGLLLDDLESATIVTGSGEILSASEKERCELFWGLRGADQNFGIVTSATFQIHD